MTERERKRDLRELVLLSIGVFVALVWGVVVLVQSIWPSHEVPAAVHGVMLTTAGSFFVGAARAGRVKDA